MVIDKRFNNLLEPLDLETDEQVSTVLADKSKMQALLEHLKVKNEMSDDKLLSIRAHYNLAEEIGKAEEAKK